MLYQLLGITILLIFYGIYVGKMLAQKKRGIQTNQIAKGRKKTSLLATELVMNIATYSVVTVEFVSIVNNAAPESTLVRIAGICLSVGGVLIFGMAVFTMKDSWRAGIPEKDKTEMITGGIYGISRNPAFAGFDLVYLGTLLTFFNRVLLVFTVAAMLMLHLQILQEEAFLSGAFGDEYAEYKGKVRRYLGRKRS